MNSDKLRLGTRINYEVWVSSTLNPDYPPSVCWETTELQRAMELLRACTGEAAIVVCTKTRALMVAPDVKAGGAP